MSAIGDECIGHGGLTSGEESINSYNPNAPHPKTDEINLDPEIKRLKEFQVTSSVSSELIAESLKKSIAESKAVRETALHNAKVALEEAFGGRYKKMVEEKKNTLQQKLKVPSGAYPNVEEYQKVPTKDEKRHVVIKRDSSEDGDDVISNQEIDELTAGLEDEVNKYLGTKNVPAEEIPEKITSVDKTRDLINNFREKTAKFPKYLSYEGSMVLCVLLSMKERVFPSITNLPMVDQTLIRELLPSKYQADIRFQVEFDDIKDFNFKFFTDGYDAYKFTMFNSVAHPRPEDISNGQGEIRIDEGEEKLIIGNKISISKMRGRFQKLAGINSNDAKSKVQDTKVITTKDVEEEYISRRQPVAGRNAYEVRSDIIAMALDYSLGNKNNMSPEEIVGVARKFYDFVENKNHKIY